MGSGSALQTDHVDKKENTSKLFTVRLLTPGGAKTIRVSDAKHIWDAAFDQGVTLPALCHQGWCLTCAGRIEGTGEVDQTDSLAYFPQDRNERYALLCTGKPCSDLTIRTEQAVAMRRNRLRNRLPAPYSQGLEP